ncbi:hypothetical protein M2163_006081 [Streptomyces sp. SAI-135]|uniref:hypothetical protein n=1 Tax=unclassified Streptomyces TaxID=2593676 RepID=UPI002472EF88|nr:MULTISPECIES: hypothetical protein [unclassified Streptomyces]MDH6516938.1 hypothetical protein [Streptomyces sp. SAI-090]MDH6618973.1 hypothetical protein [Streptomyces sp. SAI-135]
MSTTSDRDGHGMGDERNGEAPGRRRARPEETVRGREQSYGPESRYDDSPLEALLAAALRGGKAEDEAERRAVAAFRAARDAGTHRARTRRRDDWRPRERRRARSLKATLCVLLGSLTLGGVAYAAIGSVGGGPDQGAVGGRDVRPSVSAGTSAGSPGGARPSASVPAERPSTAKDTLAHCRAYEKLRGRGEALDATAFQRLVTAAGGEGAVSAYCTALTDAADAKGAAGENGAGNANGGGNANSGGNAGDAGGAQSGSRQGTSGQSNAGGNKSGKQ